MNRIVLFEEKSLYRASYTVRGFEFGAGEKTACIIGNLRGNEIQQIYICSRLVKAMKRLEEQGRIHAGHSILIVPAANPYSVNSKERFWPTDKTDINRMFPGYSLGETTQRIAAALFEQIQGYEFGVQMSSYYLAGDCIPHVRMMHTGYENVELAQGFGLPYTLLCNPRPFDTTTLNYNWQIWDTHAFSICSGYAGAIDAADARDTVSAVLRFMALHGIIQCRTHPGYYSEVLQEENLITVKARRAGILYCMCRPDDLVRRDQVLARVLDPYDGSVRWEARAPEDGTIFFVHSKALVHENSMLFRLITG